MKNPNGYGTVYKLSGNRRKPYVAKKAAIYDDEGKHIQKAIGYYATRKEALQALALYNANPYDLDSAKTTIAELFETFKERKYDKISKSGVYVYNAAFKHLAPLHNKPIKDIKSYEIQRIIDNMDRSWQTKSHVQALIHQLFDIAIELDIVQKNYAEFVKVGEKEKSEIHKPFTNEEIQILWDNVLKDYADTVLIMIYTGMRPSEMLQLKKDDIDLEKRVMIGGLKTKAGKNRQIPIAKSIYKLIEHRYNYCNKYLIEGLRGKKLHYVNYKFSYDQLMKELNFSHLPHDCRHTFVTMADAKGINNTIIKKIVGHSSQDVTEGIYTHKSLEMMLEAVDSL